ncbi:MAG: response regulator [Burkholderiaceae bacterium]
MLDITSVNGLDREIDRIKREKIGQRFHLVNASMAPVTQWANQLSQEFQPHFDAVRSLKAMADRTRPTVLVVDDDDDFQCKMLGKILEAENYHLVFAAGGVEALSILHKIRPDLILMDAMMPGMDGMETTRRLKAIPQFANVPVVMATGKSVGNVVTDSLKAGAIDFVVKPFDREILIGKVARALCTTIKS